MNIDLTRKQRELEHDKKILETSSQVWGRAGRAGKSRLKRRAEMIVESCGVKPGKKVLEIGCGTGSLVKFLVETGADVVATDIFPEFLELAKKNVGEATNVEFKIEDAQILASFPDESFDVVCGLSILHHLNVNLTLKNIYRVLKPGGVMAFSEPNMLNPQIAIQKNIPLIKRWLGDSPDETAFFSWQMRRLLRGTGYQDVEIRSFDFLHPAIPDSLANICETCGKILEKIPLIKEIGGSLFIYAKK